MSALIAAAPNHQARLLILEQWGAGHRVSEALALEPRDLRLDTDQPTLRIREGQGRKSREVLLHPKLQAALIAATSYGAVGGGPWSTFHGRRPDGGSSWRHVGTHTLRNSYAHHLLLNGIPLNYLSRWLGHASIQTTLVCLELVPDPACSLASVP